METTFPTIRRSLPPVPRSTIEAPGTVAQPLPRESAAAEAVLLPEALAIGGPAELAPDAAQEFVSRLRGAAPQFAAAAGAQSAVVREAVPPARHRRSRCRVVLRYADGGETDLTFLGPVDRVGSEAPAGFGDSIQRWLTTGQQRAAGWLVPDEDALDGVAVDLTAWLAAG